MLTVEIIEDLIEALNENDELVGKQNVDLLEASTQKLLKDLAGEK